MVLLVLGVLAVAFDAHFTGHGALAASGIVALLAGMALIAWSLLPLALAGLTMLVLGGGLVYFGLPAYYGWKRLLHRPPSGQIVGRTALVARALGPEGWVMVDGAYWRAVCPIAHQRQGDMVLVIERSGLTLVVSPVCSSEAQLLSLVGQDR